MSQSFNGHEVIPTSLGQVDKIRANKMQRIKHLLNSATNNVLAHLGLQLIRLYDAKNEGFDGYLSQARRDGMDVNDWLEKKLNWGNALLILESTVFPYIKDDSIVCEIGAGTGRHARYIKEKVKDGQLHLVDHSQWIVRFLQRYFQQATNVHAHLGDGHSLSFLTDSFCDLVFSDGTFIALKLGVFYLYSREFVRILKPGGYCILNYIDINTAEGWKHLESQPQKLANVYTYYTPDIMDKVFKSAGFDIVKHNQFGNRTYLIARRPDIHSSQSSFKT